MPDPAEVHVALSGLYRIEHLARLIRQLEPVLTLQKPSRVVVDLDRLAGLSPAALALLAAALRRIDEAGLCASGTRIRPPGSPLVRNYLLRMDLIGMLPGWEDVDEEFERHPEMGFRPCQHFSTEKDYPAVALSLTDALCESVAVVDTVARSSIRICLDELCENVVHHAHAPGGAVAVAQGWRSKGRFEFAIVDLGRGILTSLRDNPALAHLTGHGEAIATALEPGVSSTPERNAGIGLFVTKLLFKANGGTLLVRSGDSGIYSGAREETLTAEPFLPGTLVTFRALTARPLDVNAVYAYLDEIEQEAEREA